MSVRSGGRRRRWGCLTVLVLVTVTGCSHSDITASWVVRSVSRDGRMLHLALDVSCNAKLVKSRVHEYRDRVLIEIATHAPGGSCKASLTVQAFDVQLSAPLGNRWVDGACVGGCPGGPDHAALRCSLNGPPFGVGYLPSGWRAAERLPAGTVAAYQSATGDATLELSHNDRRAPAHHGDEELYVLGNQVPVDTISGGFSVAVDLAGTGPACGRWVFSAHGVERTAFATIVQELFPR